MDFETWWDGQADDALARFAKTVGSTTGYLYLVARGHKRVSHKLAAKIEQETGGKVTKQHLRPDIFGTPKRKAA